MPFSRTRILGHPFVQWLSFLGLASRLSLGGRDDDIARALHHDARDDTASLDHGPDGPLNVILTEYGRRSGHTRLSFRGRRTLQNAKGHRGAGNLALAWRPKGTWKLDPSRVRDNGAQIHRAALSTGKARRPLAGSAALAFHRPFSLP